MKVWGCHSLQGSDGWTSNFNSHKHLNPWLGISLLEFADCEGSKEEEIKQQSHETHTSAGNMTLRVVVNFYGEKLKKK